jgi:predicted nucleic acid-binding protein
VRVVLDPGIVVSALIAPKALLDSFDLLLEDRFDIVVSQRLLDELTGGRRWRRCVGLTSSHG